MCVCVWARAGIQWEVATDNEEDMKDMNIKIEENLIKQGDEDNER